MKIVTLSNGLRVANFSSPHDFNFTDGSILPTVDAEKSKRLSMESIETVIAPYTIELKFQNTVTVKLEITLWWEREKFAISYKTILKLNKLISRLFFVNLF